MPRKKKANSFEGYKIFETDEYSKRLNKLSKRDSEYIENKLRNYTYDQLRDEPHYGTNIKKLKDYVPEMWRYRIGKFRVFYTIDEENKIVFIITVEFRKDAY